MLRLAFRTFWRLFLRSFSRRPEQDVIQEGDLLHVDFGITYLRLNTDTQQHAYVLKTEEREVPSYLKNPSPMEGLWERFSWPSTNGWVKRPNPTWVLLR